MESTFSAMAKFRSTKIQKINGISSRSMNADCMIGTRDEMAFSAAGHNKEGLERADLQEFTNITHHPG